MAPFGITDDSECTSDLLLRLTARQRCYLASGYFNLTPDYMDIVVDRSPAQYRLLYASPEVFSLLYSTLLEYSGINIRPAKNIPIVFEINDDVEFKSQLNIILEKNGIIKDGITLSINIAHCRHFYLQINNVPLHSSPFHH